MTTRQDPTVVWDFRALYLYTITAFSIETEENDT